MILDDQNNLKNKKEEQKPMSDSTDGARQSDARRGQWRQPPRDILVRFQLEELRNACAKTTRAQDGEGELPPSSPPWLCTSPQLERATIYPAYRRLQEVFGSLLASWEMTSPNLPEFIGALATAQLIQAICTGTVRVFEPRCSLRDAARIACSIWTLRHVGWNLLGQAWDERADWYPSNPDWECCDDPIPISECYGDPAPFPEEMWDIAMSREASDDCLRAPLAYVMPDFLPTSRAPECALHALQGLGPYGEFYIGHLPVLPLLAWASTAGWPERLWERIDAYVQRQALELTRFGGQF